MKKFFFAIIFLCSAGYVCAEDGDKEAVSYPLDQNSKDSYENLKNKFFEYFSEFSIIRGKCFENVHQLSQK